MFLDDDETDLENAELYADGSHGVYIPQYFAESVKRDCVTGVSDWAWTQCEAGPDAEHYWDAWTEILDRATIAHPVLGPCYLWQDGDLWVIPRTV
jgi:hypothetical protein